MSNLEHYFENLLFEGKDCHGDVNKNSLTKEEQEAVEICAQYVIYTLFDNREGFKEFIHSEPKRGKWIVQDKGLKTTSYHCSECGRFIMDDTGYDVIIDYPYCNCGAKMEGIEE